MIIKPRNRKFDLEEYLIRINDKILRISETDSQDRIDLYVENRRKVLELIKKNGIELKNKTKLEQQFQQIMSILKRKRNDTEHEINKNKRIQKNNRLYLKG